MEYVKAKEEPLTDIPVKKIVKKSDLETDLEAELSIIAPEEVTLPPNAPTLCSIDDAITNSEETLHENVNKLEENIIESVSEPVEKVIESVSEPVEKVIESVSEPVEKVIESVSEPVEKVIESVSEPVEKVIESVSEPTENIPMTKPDLVENVEEPESTDSLSEVKKKDEDSKDSTRLLREKLVEERKSRVLAQKEALKRKIIDLNLDLSHHTTSCEEREPIYKEIIKAQESLLFISGYYAKLLNGEVN